jgi:hypothetical protein
VLEALDAGRDEVDDRLHLTGGHALAGLVLDEHRGAGLAAVLGEQALLGDDEVHGRRLDPIDGGDGLGKLPLERALVVHALAELGGGDALLVEQLVAGLAVLRQAGGRQVQAQLVDVLLRDEHCAAPVGQLVRRAASGELLGDGRRVGGGQVREDRHQRGGCSPRT